MSPTNNAFITEILPWLVLPLTVTLLLIWSPWKRLRQLRGATGRLLQCVALAGLSVAGAGALWGAVLFASLPAVRAWATLQPALLWLTLIWPLLASTLYVAFRRDRNPPAAAARSDPS